MEVKPEDLFIFADEELIQMVLINLVKNSIEAAGKVKNPRISLKGSVDFELKATIEITDNGEGIIPEALERIFVPFYTTKKTGSGIGLALSRQIMQLHNGTISVESTPGIRTTFTLRFN
jgi:signal transduction histidine kinase